MNKNIKYRKINKLKYLLPIRKNNGINSIIDIVIDTIDNLLFP